MATRIVLYDYEVFRHDTLLGATIIDTDNVYTVQTWDLNEQKSFYDEHHNSIWIGHNNAGYDNFILQDVVNNKVEEQIFKTSKEIIDEHKRKYLDIPLIYYDLMSNHQVSLKTVECTIGKNISLSEVDFNLDRKLTPEEKLKTEAYNRDDLSQTFDDFNFIKGEFLLRVDVIKEFGLPWSALHVTGTQLAEMVLHAETTPGIENWYVAPPMYPQLQVKNQEVLDFYKSEGFRNGKRIKVKLCGVEHTIGSGGIHAAKSKYHAKSALYFDVSGYYNLVMINYNLLPRSIPAEYREFYKQMYEQQLLFKKTAPEKRWTYKTILLSVFGAMTNPYCKFYDPNHGTLVTMTGEMFLVDLLEKLEGKVDLVQSNTDGIIAAPLPGVTKEELLVIIDEWQNRTGFVLHLDEIYDIHQRDVNCYMYRNGKGEIQVLGEALRYYNLWENPFAKCVYQAKEPPIFHYCIVDCFMNNILPEETIEKYKRELRLFQYVCKKGTYEWVEYETYDKETKQKTVKQVDYLNRAFAWKNDEQTGMLYKCKAVGKTTRAKIPQKVESVFIYNDEILSDEAIDKLMPMIDYDYYIKRAYERIQEFIEMDEPHEQTSRKRRRKAIQ